jgi:hypothetical protein
VGLATQLASGLSVLHQAGTSTQAYEPLNIDTVALLPPPADAIVLNPFRFISSLSKSSCFSSPSRSLCGHACVAPEEHPPEEFAHQHHAFNAQMADVWRSAASTKRSDDTIISAVVIRSKLRIILIPDFTMCTMHVGKHTH